MKLFKRKNEEKVIEECFKNFIWYVCDIFELKDMSESEKTELIIEVYELIYFYCTFIKIENAINVLNKHQIRKLIDDDEFRTAILLYASEFEYLYKPGTDSFLSNPFYVMMKIFTENIYEDFNLENAYLLMASFTESVKNL